MNESAQLGTAIELSIRRHLSSIRIAPECLRSLRVEREIDFITQDMVIQMVADIASRKYDTIVIEYPETWVDALRERFAPNLLVGRWPIRKRKHVIDIYDAYPSIDVAGHRPVRHVNYYSTITP